MIMATIKHLVTINAPIDKVYHAVSTQQGVRDWWTAGAHIEEKVGGTLEFTFGESNYYNKMRMEAMKQSNYIEWLVVESDPEWLNTRIKFEMEEPEPGKTQLRFMHEGWADTTDFYGQCSYHWGHYMSSIKKLCETGEGMPYGSLKEYIQ